MENISYLNPNIVCFHVMWDAMPPCYSSYYLTSAVGDKTCNKGRAISECSVPNGTNWGGLSSCIRCEVDRLPDEQGLPQVWRHLTDD